MTEPTSHPMTGAPPGARAAPTAGGILRGAREAMGMSLDTVAQQLKLAPRQVTALEEDDFARLPGRTFVRGFLRNYARLVRVDPEKVLAALPGGDAPSLDSPALQPTAPTIGELPTVERAKAGWTRWAIPLTLVAVIAAAAFYEFSRGRGDLPHALAPPPGTSEPERSSPSKTSAGASETPLPSPIGAPPAPAAESAGAPAGAAPAAAPAAGVSTPPPGAPTPSGPRSAEVTIVLTYRDASWTEVKDGHGQVVVAQMMPAGQARSITGVPPLNLVVGNATEVSATLRGQPLDLAPVTQKGVARFVVE